jgi:hypothetical protein
MSMGYLARSLRGCFTRSVDDHDENATPDSPPSFLSHSEQREESRSSRHTAEPVNRE